MTMSDKIRVEITEEVGTYTTTYVAEAGEIDVAVDAAVKAMIAEKDLPDPDAD